MQSNCVFSRLITAWVAMPVVILVLSAASASAQTNSPTYSFVVGSGFLCELGDSASCLAVAKSANGDSYEISGAGTFDPQNKSVKAAGTFNHKSTNGNVLETGVWTASDLISFGSYGAAPATLLQKGSAFGLAQIGPKRLSMPPGPTPTGGLAIFRILLVPLSGTTKTAMLQVNCALGDVPRERAVEGIRVTLEKSGSEFSEEAGGRVMFLSLRPVSVSPNATQPALAPDSPETPSN